jgi:outer membrane lipoprotein carrier protein
VELPRAVGLTGALLGILPAAEATPNAVELVRQLDRHRQAVADLSARFTQTYVSGSIGREVVERGVVFLKRPGRMLWKYQRPEEKTFVADGKSFYFYIPAERQVIVRDQAGQRGIPALLLSEEASLLTQFEAALEDAPAGVRRLRLTPKKADPDVESVLLDVDAGYRVRTVRIHDAQGNQSRFDFSEIKENVGLQDRLFRFEIPKGVEVISG